MKTYSLFQNNPLSPRQIYQLPRLLPIRRKRFLAEHMFPLLDRLGRPLEMQSVGRRHVHDIHLRIVEQFVVRAVSFCEVVLFRGGFGDGGIAGGDGVEDYVGVGFGGMDCYSFY